MGGGVRVSLAESADAFRAIEELGVMDREVFRLGLRTTLVKEADDLPTFDEMFPLFFGVSEAPPLMNLAEDLTPEEAEMLADALKQFTERLRDMLERMIQGKPLSQQELDQLGQMVGLNRADNLRQKEWMARRMAQALKFKDVQEALEKLQELLAQMGMNKQRIDQMRQILQSNQQSMMEQLRNHAGQQIAENMAESRPEDNVDALMNRPFNALSDKDMDILRKEVGRWPPGFAAVLPCARNARRPATSTPSVRSARTSSMAACRSTSSIGIARSSRSWSLSAISALPCARSPS